MLDCVVCKRKKKQIKLLFYILLHDLINNPAFVDIKQTLRYKLAME